MIVYYDPDTFEIRGMSGIVDSNNTYPYIETEDPLATRIFLRQEKALNFVVVARPGQRQGEIKPKPSKNTALITVAERVYRIPNYVADSEVVVRQNKDSKIIEVQLLADTLDWWQQDAQQSKKKLYLVACLDNPYYPIWTKQIAHSDFENSSVVFPYQGQDNFVLYTPKMFFKYSHEIISK